MGGGGEIPVERDLSVTCMCRYLIPERGGIRIGRGWEGRGRKGRGNEFDSNWRKEVQMVYSCWFACQIDGYRGRWRREEDSFITDPSGTCSHVSTAS